jgi:hypothetical protein
VETQHAGRRGPGHAGDLLGSARDDVELELGAGEDLAQARALALGLVALGQRRERVGGLGATRLDRPLIDFACQRTVIPSSTPNSPAPPGSTT